MTKNGFLRPFGRHWQLSIEELFRWNGVARNMVPRNPDAKQARDCIRVRGCGFEGLATSTQFFGQ